MKKLPLNLKYVNKQQEGHSFGSCKKKFRYKTLQELKRKENIEEPDNSGRSIVVENDYEVDLSKSSYEEWLKDNNFVDASSEKEDVKPASDVVIEIDTTNGEIRK